MVEQWQTFQLLAELYALELGIGALVSALTLLCLILLRRVGKGTSGADASVEVEELPFDESENAVTLDSTSNGGDSPLVSGESSSSAEELISKKPLPLQIEEGESVEHGGVRRGLKRTRSAIFSKLRQLISATNEDLESKLSGLEEHLLSCDLGVGTTKRLLAQVRTVVEESGRWEETTLRAILGATIRNILFDRREPEIVAESTELGPMVIVIVGVNGVGKTTTIGKLAAQFRSRGANVVVAACDTFRAAAADQLSIWTERAGVTVVRGEEGAKPSTVAYLAAKESKEKRADVLIVDTAGRLHTRVNLMNELAGVTSILEREFGYPANEILLVLDASTGQNALQQAREFNSKVGLTGLVVTKLDGTPRGGVVVAVKEELGIPLRYIGVGEGIEDLRVFSADEFTEALLAENDDSDEIEEAPVREHAKVRRRRRGDEEVANGE